MSLPVRMTFLLLLFVGPSVGLSAADTPSGEDFFEASVRPALTDACIRCHGPKKQQGGLRLDSREALLTGGDNGPAIVAGQPEKSLLIRAVRHTGELKMPPDKPLAEKHVEALAKWVTMGAPWPKGKAADTGAKAAAAHWAFQPVRVAPPPAVRAENRVRSPIDRFVFAKLEAEGLTPSPSADQRTLIRRVTYGLTGLPPTPEEVEAFVKDDSPTAYARLVERLLASPQYGEQWARHWLDVARYSDTKGYVYGREERFWVHAWVYRDWVVRALNSDMPYDRFVLLQLAADQVAPDDPPSQAAMGLLTLGRRFLGVTHDIIDDRIDTVTRGLLGLTAACARCHDHKYDPIPTQDYYSLYGVFRNSAERLVPASTAPPTDKAFEKGLRDRQKKLADKTSQRRAEAANRARARTGDYLEAQLEMHKYPEEGFDQILTAGDLIPATVRKWRDYLARTGVHRDPVFLAWHAYAKLKPEEFANASPVKDGHRLVARLFATPPKDMRDVARRYASLFAQAELRHGNRFAAAVGSALLPLADATTAELAELHRVLHADDAPCVVPDEPVVETEAYFPSDVVNELWKLQGDVDRWIIQSSGAAPFAAVLVDRPQPVNTRILRRGNPATPGAEAPRQFLQLLAGPNRQPFQAGSGRLELAKAIVDPKNPLTARVMVNRVWMHHFGAGLVTTPSDFGVRAEAPSHPELLDWLASRFVAEGWSLKKLHREIVLSATYQQAATGPADAAIRNRAMARDPGNRLLWRANPRRLSFEELRDSLFAVGGQLNTAVGGKPSDVMALAAPARRTLYGLVDRQFPLDVLRVFDFANPDLHIPQRSETTVPQQALFFLNHPLPLDRAKAIAKHPTVATAATPDGKVRQLYRLIYQREPTASQLRAAVALAQAAEAEIASPTTPKPTMWSYGVAAFDPKTNKLTGFKKLPHFTGGAWQGGEAYPDPAFGWAQLTATGGHPGNDLAHAVVRRWTAPKDTTVKIESLLQHQEKAGDGVRATILSSRHGLLKVATAHHSDAAMNVEKVDVKAGDTIDFVVDILGVLNTDQHLWAPVVADTAGTTWSAKDDFGGPVRPQLGPWEQLAQALLMANEFCFVD